MLPNELLEELKNAPLLLLTVKDKETIDYFNNLIPYSTGFEIECNWNESYNKDNFLAIPDLMELKSDNYEQRYRIPNGIRGMICLYHISIQLKYNLLLNLGSGIHYQIDCTDSDSYNQLYRKQILEKNKNWILTELDAWGIPGKGTMREVGYWFRYNSSHNTIEYRVGEMTFDYRILLKRIIHCNSITSRLKLQLDGIKEPVFEEPDVRKILEYGKHSISNLSNYQIKIAALNRKIEELNKATITPTVEVPIIRNRTHKIN